MLKLADIPEDLALTLAAPILDPHGTVLVPAGAALATALRRSLARRGVEQVCVLVDDGPAPDIERIRARVERLFRKCGDNVAANELMHRMLTYRMRRPS
jgi:hypothetical protein